MGIGLSVCWAGVDAQQESRVLMLSGTGNVQTLHPILDRRKQLQQGYAASIGQVDQRICGLKRVVTDQVTAGYSASHILKSQS